VTIPVRIPFTRRWLSYSLGIVEDPSSVLSLGSFTAAADGEQIRRERARARELRRTQWWKRRRASGICHYCGGRFAPQTLTMDHVVPLVRGGRSTRGNVVPACKGCNAGKKHKLSWEQDLSDG
jgi:5-methylcytosine-specific restriction enzyme A